MGARTCLDCHRSEYVSWLATDHSSNSINRYEITDTSIAKKYLDRGGKLERCYSCHTAPAEKRFGRLVVEHGTSCESCHGAAGGSDGWLNRHAVYGPNLTSLEQETPQHYKERVAFCENAGMVRAERQYEIAKNCFTCHLIGDPALINDEVGHPVEDERFSLLLYLDSDVRHNFHLNQRKNAETPTLDTMRRGLSAAERKRVYLVLEAFAKMEVALTYLSDLPNDEAIDQNNADDLIDVFEDGSKDLEDYFDELEDPVTEGVAPLTEEDTQVLRDAVQVFEDFDDLDEPTRAETAKAAQDIRRLAKQFLAEFGDGSRLVALDDFFEEPPENLSKPLQP